MSSATRKPETTPSSASRVTAATRKRAQEALLAALLADDARRSSLRRALFESRNAGEAAVAAERWAERSIGHTHGWVGVWAWLYWKRLRRGEQAPSSVAERIAFEECRRTGVKVRRRSNLEIHASWLVQYQAGTPLRDISVAGHLVGSPQAVIDGVRRIAAAAEVRLVPRRRGPRPKLPRAERHAHRPRTGQEE